MKFRVAVLGPLGTYTHEAAYELLGPDVVYDECKTIQGVFDSLLTSANAGVVPQENTIFGNVIETYDALRDAGFVCGETTLQIRHCLLVRPGVQLHQIKKILSHEQALGQCQDWIKTHIPSASLLKTTSTAAAAQALLDSPLDCAAISSRLCASLFNLSILYEGIQNESNNSTRFYLITGNKDTPLPAWLPKFESKRTLLQIIPQHPSTSPTGPGISQLLAALKINFRRIDRRPARNTPPFYDIYFVELQNDDVIGYDAWLIVIRKAIERIQLTGGDARLIGLW